MNSNIKSLILATGAMLAMTSCSENSWNDKYLDGFDGGLTPTQVETIDYTLTAADYANLAKNSDNKALADKNGVVSQLSAVESQQYLNADIPASVYIPNFLKDANFRYFALSDGSAINLTYREAGELPEVMKNLNGVSEYTVTDEDYQKVYGSDNDYTAAFTPSHPASKSISDILDEVYPDAEDGQYVVANYNVSDTDPVFGSGPTPPTPGFTMTSVLTKDLAVGENVTVNGVVTAVCNAGIILTDKAGSILVYAKEFPAADYKVGDQVVATGELANYKNCLQLPYADNLQKVGTQSYTYPTATEFTPAMLLAAGLNESPVLAQYGCMTGTVNIDGNYINLLFGDRTDVRGSIYNATDAIKAQLQDGAEMTLEGYFTQTSTSGTFTNCNFVVTKVSAAKKNRRKAATRSVTVPSTSVNAAYVFNGSKWEAAASDIYVVQPEDYKAMGLTYGNFSNNQTAEYLPLLLARKFPYAQAETVKYIAYKFYAGNVTSYACAQWSYDGSKWYDSVASNGVQTVTNQFVRRDGKWVLDPSIELTLPAGRNQPLSTWFFQACVDWVKDNVSDGAAYITSYGNNDYYTGASAYQGNIDLRPGSAKGQNPTAYDSLTDDEVVALLKKHFEYEVGPGVLSVLYPNLAPVGDYQPTVTINFYTYNGTSTAPQTIVFKCISKAKFEFVSCTWNE